MEPDFVSVIRMLLDREVVEGGYWWTLDETSVPTYKSRAITEGERAALNIAVPNPDERIW